MGLKKSTRSLIELAKRNKKAIASYSRKGFADSLRNERNKHGSKSTRERRIRLSQMMGY